MLTALGMGAIRRYVKGASPDEIRRFLGEHFRELTNDQFQAALEAARAEVDRRWPNR